MPGRLVFSTTADGASNPTEQMRIDSSGKVGVGKFDVSGNARIGAGSGGNFENAGTRLLVANTGGDLYQLLLIVPEHLALRLGGYSVANRAGIDWSASTVLSI